MDIEVCSSYHLGHMVLDAMKEHPHYLSQIDVVTGEEQTYATVISNSIRLAKCLRNFGLKPGDVLAVNGHNHVNIFLPFYAGLFNGQPVVGVDPYFKFDEIKTLLNITKPRVVICQASSFNDFVQGSQELRLEMKVITFDEGDNSLSKFIDKYDDGTPTYVFKVAEFDTDKIYAFLCTTSGTTGGIKAAAFTHKQFILKTLACVKLGKVALNSTNNANIKNMHVSPASWMTSAFLAVFTPILGVCKVMTSNPDDFSLIIDMINKYKPVNGLISPALAAYLMSRKEDVDLTCFRTLSMSGAKINKEVAAQLRTRLSKKGELLEYYGLTEAIGIVLLPQSNGPVGNCGTSSNFFDIKLVDIETENEIKEPYVSGEIWCKGTMFSGFPTSWLTIWDGNQKSENFLYIWDTKEYYNDPQATAEAFSPDGYLKTGDILYRDENNYYYFVDRKKTLIKYKSHHVYPSEIEDVIISHPGVAQVVVIAIPDIRDGEHPVSCVVRKNGTSVTAQEIKDLVASKLSSNKELRGGVVFLDTLPMTSTNKIALGKLLKLVLNSKRE